MRRARYFAPLAITAIVALAGCGSSSHTAATHTPTVGTAAPITPLPRQQSPSPSPDPVLPSHVPRVGTGPADAASVRVIRAWLRALDAGDIRRAASYFGLPSTFQNGGGVVKIASRGDRLALNATFPCGAKVAGTQGAAGFVIVDYLLTERRNGACGAGTGQHARGAIRVRRGKIVEWYRLPDAPGPNGQPIVPDAPGRAV